MVLFYHTIDVGEKETENWKKNKKYKEIHPAGLCRHRVNENSVIVSCSC